MAIIDKFDEYDHFVTDILVSLILVVSVNLVMKRSFWSWTDGHIGNKTVIQVRDNGHFGNYSYGILGPHRTRTKELSE